MKAPDCAYVKPSSLDEAAACLEALGEEATILAGGQSLMATLNFRLSAPQALVDLNGAAAGNPELAEISDRGETVRIGALVRHADIERSDIVAGQLPIMAAAAKDIAHPAIRNRGTFCGSLAHGDPAAEWPAMAIMLDATLALHSAQGVRTVKAREYYTGLFDSVRQSGEILAFVDIPKLSTARAYGFYELARRHGDFALAGACVSTLRGEILRDCRVSFFGVHSHACLAHNVAAALNGQSPDAPDEAALGAAIAEDLAPFDDIHASAGQRLHLARVTLRRALAAL